MHLLVGLKWVPLRPEIDPLSGRVTIDERFCGISPADQSALEWALRLASTGPLGSGSVTAVCIGPAAAGTVLRQALAAGADDAILVEVPDDQPSPVVAAELASLAQPRHERGRLDLICTGDLSLDRGSGAVPALVANQLGWPQALGLVRAEIGTDPLTVERRLDRGRRERLAVEGPAVVSFERGPELRRAPLGAVLAAGSSEVTVTGPSSGLVEAASGAPRPVRPIGHGPYRPPASVVAAPTGTTRQRVAALTGGAAPAPTGGQIHQVSPAEAAQLAVAQLEAWGYLDPDPDSDPDPDRGRS